MRLEIDTAIIDGAQAEYNGPETTGKGLVVWLLQRFTAGDIDSIRNASRTCRERDDDTRKVLVTETLRDARPIGVVG